MTKTFPKVRICVVDLYPAIKKGITESINFMETNNIDITSMDGKRVLMGNCLKEIQTVYKQSPNIFQKVCFIDNKTLDIKVRYFVETYVHKMMKKLPMPYCGIISSDSPDLEFAAESSLTHHKSSRNLEILKKGLKLKSV